MNAPETPLEAIQQLVVAHGGNQSSVARHLGITRAYMSDILNGRRGISARIAAAVGFKKRVVCEWKKSKKSKAKP